jgi:hypothetical protein
MTPAARRFMRGRMIRTRIVMPSAAASSPGSVSELSAEFRK